VTRRTRPEDLYEAPKREFKSYSPKRKSPIRIK